MKNGIAVSNGYAFGTVFLKDETNECIVERKVKDKDAEIKKLDNAIKIAKAQLTKIRDKSVNEFEGSGISVFDSHLMLLEDPEFIGKIYDVVNRDSVNVEKALMDVIKGYMKVFEQIDDEYIKERYSDIKDVGRRLMSILCNNVNVSLKNIPDNSIIVAKDLTPSDTAQLDKKKVLAFLTDQGAYTSHTAIIARAMGIPAIVGMENITKKVCMGDKLIVDGVSGRVFINPTDEEINEYNELKAKFESYNINVKNFVNNKVIENKGKRVHVLGNISEPEEALSVARNSGDGIGLFRTEFLFMDRETVPCEDEQFEAYKYVLENMGDKIVVIRTIDIGGDKKVKYLNQKKEMNPFLGLRAIRYCLKNVDFFKVQLRALLRASCYGNLHIMFPMISDVSEFSMAKEIAETCRKELLNEGKKVSDNIKYGIMVEIPSAALMADEFADKVDFFSLGTNDLIQYTLAVDRMNSDVSNLYNEYNPAVLKLIKMTIEAAHKKNKWCGMCGEMAGDEKAVPILLKYGLDEFSVNPPSILKTKKLLMDNIHR